MANVKVPTQALSPMITVTVGGVQQQTMNPLWVLAADATINGIHDRYRKDGYLHLNNVTDLDAFSIDIVEKVIGAKGEVEEYPVFFELTATAYAKNVPDYMPNSTVTDEDGATTPVKWSDYGADNQPHVEIGGKHYINSNPFGVSIPASIWTQLDSETGIKVLSVAEYKALQVTSEDL